MFEDTVLIIEEEDYSNEANDFDVSECEDEGRVDES